MASNQQQYDEQLKLLEERFPNESKHRLRQKLRDCNGDLDQVRAYFFHREFRDKKRDSLEAQYGTVLDTLQQQYPSSQSLKRPKLLKVIERFGGEIEYIRQYLEKLVHQSDDTEIDPNETKEQKRARRRNEYAAQLSELSTAGINTKCPCVLHLLDKHNGDVNKIMEIMMRQKEKKEKASELNVKYEDELAQLEADGIKIKNKKYLLQLLEKADGQIDVVKQLIAGRNGQKHRAHSSSEEDEEKVISISKKQQHDIDVNDIDHIKQLRAAGVYGNPTKILAVFHECNNSIELTVARLQKEREERKQESKKRLQHRTLLVQTQDAYLNINHRNDWPNNIEQVYLDGNNMMFVVDCLRKLCLNRAGKKTERAIAQLANAWNEQMHIPNVELIFDSTHQLEQVGCIKVATARPTYQTTDDMLIDIARRNDNHEKNKRTIIVTSDRDLAIQLSNEGCQLVKSYAWFAHCAMVLTPDLINEEEEEELSTETTTKPRKCRYNLDELVRRIAHIE